MQQTATGRINKLGLAELISIGVGGMIGGGIFSVLGLAVNISGHAAPMAFAIVAVIALFAGYAFVKLALAFPGDGSNFTYFHNAFPNHIWVASLSGWAIIVGYVGTLALYAFTFGAYGAHLFGADELATARMVLSTGALLFFMTTNLKGVRETGVAEDLVVYLKIIVLSLFAVVGLFNVKQNNFTPVFDQGVAGVFMAGALIFVAYEGFQLITNAMDESRAPERNVPRAIYASILITSIIYVTLTLVEVGNLPLGDIVSAEEYALARVAEPVMGNLGVVLVDLAALLATSSAINGTVFGAARLMAVVAEQKMMPASLARRSEQGGSFVANGLRNRVTVAGSLEAIASFSSMTFLLISAGVSIANLRLRQYTICSSWIVVSGIVLMGVTIMLLAWYLWLHSRNTLFLILGLYVFVFAIERAYQKVVRKRKRQPLK